MKKATPAEMAQRQCQRPVKPRPPTEFVLKAWALLAVLEQCATSSVVLQSRNEWCKVWDHQPHWAEALWLVHALGSDGRLERTQEGGERLMTPADRNVPENQHERAIDRDVNQLIDDLVGLGDCVRGIVAWQVSYPRARQLRTVNCSGREARRLFAEGVKDTIICDLTDWPLT
jgi:hypothetical protein